MRREVHEISGGRKLYMYSFGSADPAAERQRRFWNSVGDAWKHEPEAIEAWMEPVTRAISTRLGDRAQIALDLGCGARSMKLPPKWRVFGVDPAAEILTAGKSVQGDSRALPFKDSSVDAVVSRMAVMLDGDPVAVFREVHRMLRMGGTFTFSVWDRAEGNMGTTAIEEILRRELGIRAPEPNEPSAFRLADEGEVKAMLREAKLAPLSSERVSVPYLASLAPEANLDFVMKYIGPIRLMFDKLPTERRDAVRAEIVAALGSVNRIGSAWVHQAEREVRIL